MGTIRTEITTEAGHQYVVSISDDRNGVSQVCVSDQEGSDVVIPLGVFRTMARIVEASV